MNVYSFTRKIIIACVLVAVACTIGAVYYNRNSEHRRNDMLKRQVDRENRISTTATWKGVPEMLKYSVQADKYRLAGEYMDNPEALIQDKNLQTAYTIRVVTDFLRSLTPEQVRIISKEYMSYGNLTNEQKKTLLMLTRLPSKRDILKQGPVDQSHIFVSRFPERLHQGSFLFNWMIPTYSTNGRAFAGVWVSIKADGSDCFLQ